MAAGVERQGQPEVGLEAALVELVEDHQAHALEAGVALQPPGEDALGHHLDARGGPDPPVVAGAVADGLADLLAQQRGHAAGRGPGGEPARLEHDDRPALQPRLVEEGQRHHRRLAGPGRRLQDCVPGPAERGPEVVEAGDDR